MLGDNQTREPWQVLIFAVQPDVGNQDKAVVVRVLDSCRTRQGVVTLRQNKLVATTVGR